MFLRTLAVLVPVLSLGLVAAERELPSESLEVVHAIPGMPECPHDIRLHQGGDSISQIVSQIDRVASSIVDIPEYHDCQRLLKLNAATGGLEYTQGFFAVFVSAQLDTFERRLDSIARMQAPTAANSLWGITAAVVYAEDSYQPLGIPSPGAGGSSLSCLFLYKLSPGPAGQWAAKLVPWDFALDCGLVADVTRLSGRDLRVTRTPLAASEGFGPGDFPPVGRWEWDPSSRKQYIGVVCGASWCEVGDATGFTPTAPKTVNPTLGTKERRTRRIKGYYDEQILSDYVNGQLVLTNVSGTVFPSPDLEDHQISDFEGEWIPVAEVALSGELPSYKRKLNFERTSEGGPLNRIYLCKGSRRECVGNATVFFRWLGRGIRMPTVTPDCSTYQWWAKLEAASGGVAKYACVTRRPGITERQGVRVPGTVRWRWLATDETIWERCDEGCCEVDL